MSFIWPDHAGTATEGETCCLAMRCRPALHDCVPVGTSGKRSSADLRMRFCVSGKDADQVQGVPSAFVPVALCVRELVKSVGAFQLVAEEVGRGLSVRRALGRWSCKQVLRIRFVEGVQFQILGDAVKHLGFRSSVETGFPGRDEPGNRCKQVFDLKVAPELQLWQIDLFDGQRKARRIQVRSVEAAVGHILIERVRRT